MIMTQNEKDLLFKDLCARLPYRVKGNFQNSDDELLRKVTITYGNLEPGGMVMTGDIKPYLFPLESITEKQKIELTCIIDSDYAKFDWYNKNHFDYRGLIPMGLANDCTNLNIY